MTPTTLTKTPIPPHQTPYSDLDSRSDFEQASELRRLLNDGVATQLERGRPGFALGNIQAHPGETLTPFFIDRLRSLLDSM